MNERQRAALLNQATSLSRTRASKAVPGGYVPVWALALALVLPVTFVLPIPGSPPALAGFFGLCGVLILFTRHWLIAMLPVLAALGPYFLELNVAGVNVFGFRLLIMLLAVFSTPLTNRGSWWFNPVARRSALFILLWLSWGIVSLSWTRNVGAGFADVIILIFGLGLLLTLLSLDAHKAEHLDKLRVGWLLALVASGLSGLLEVVRGYGLPTNLTGEIVVSSVRLGEQGSRPGIRSSLGFPGNFGVFLLMAVPFVLWSIERAAGLARLLYLGALGALSVLVLYTASRLSLIGLVFQFLVYGLVLHRRWYMPFVVLGGGLAAVVVGVNLAADSNLRIMEKFEAAGSGPDRSMNHRIALTLNGLWMTYETVGRGIGAGGFEKEIAGDVPFELPIRGRIKEWNAHNHWIEMLSEYGVPVFACYMALLAWIGLLGWRAQWGRHPPEVRTLGRAVVVGLAGYVFAGVATGTIIAMTAHWMFLVSLVIMAACLHDALRPRRPDRAARPVAGAVPAVTPRG